MPEVSEILSPDISEAHADHILRLIGGGSFELDFNVKPHLCHRLNPLGSVLGVCTTCGRLG